MKNNNASMRNTAREVIEKMCESQSELENFHRRTMEHVDGMLMNADEFKLLPLVLKHLNDIRELAVS